MTNCQIVRYFVRRKKMKRVLPIIFLLVFLFGCRRADDSVNLPRGEVSMEWSTAAEGFYDEAVSLTTTNNAQPYSIMVVDHGKVVLERWYGGKNPESKYNVLSVSKTVMALATGLAVEEGLFKVEDKVIDYFPEQLPENVSDTLSTMTIRHLLTMTCGLEETPKLVSASLPSGDKYFDWIREFFASKQVSMPGTEFYYNLFAPYILSAIIENTAGEGIMDYIRPRLLEPMHITDMEWEDSPAGICIGAWGMLLCTEDMAKLGQLLLQHGKWNGHQLIPAQWVDTMTSMQVKSRPINAFLKNQSPSFLNDPANDHSQGYGYYVWRGKHGTYRMEGMRGACVIMKQEKEIVLVLTSNINIDQEHLDLIWKHFAHLL